MCEPTTIMLIGAGLSMMQTQAASKANNAAADKKAKAIGQAQVDGYEQHNRQGIEAAENATAEKDKLKRDMTSRIATAKVSAANAGVTGLSVDALLLDLSGKGLEAGTTAEINYARGEAARADQAKGMTSSTNGQLSQLNYSSGLGLLDVAGAGLQVASGYQKEQRYQANLLKGTK